MEAEEKKKQIFTLDFFHVSIVLSSTRISVSCSLEIATFREMIFGQKLIAKLRLMC